MMQEQDYKFNNRNIWMICLSVACGHFLFGYDWVVIGGAKPFYESFFAITSPSLQGWAMSSALIGCVFGAIASGQLSDHYGRKRPLILSAVLFVISAWGTAVSNDFTWFMVARIVGGVGIGLAMGLAPLFVSEIAPTARRGRLITITALMGVSGILTAQLVNMMIAEPVVAGATNDVIAQTWNGQSGWRYMFGAELVPAIAFFVSILFVPESPRWLAKMGRDQEALATLKKIGNEAYAKATLQEIKQSINSNEKSLPMKALLRPDIRPTVMIGITLAVFQQWCGINVIFNYAQDIFASAGFDINDTLKSIVATGLVNLLFTIIALNFVERIGRRRLMLIGSIGLAVIYTLMAGAYFVGVQGFPLLILVLIAIAIYSLTLAPMTWVLLSEIFPTKVRGSAMSVATFFLWVACFLLTYTFPIINSVLGAAGSFFIYAVICALGFVYILKNVPETKGISLEILEESLRKRALEKSNVNFKESQV
ncbi:sugar porter family MFS transporter [Vibrio sp. 10N.261.51.F12]|uniref:sugar porter family MFS transporter n=1 Tax=Vibrio sp. 10N.261.51.F12 TaxID=3229679 RepID=UPI003550A6F7